MSDEESAYVDAVSEIAATVGPSLERAGALLTNPNVADPDWTTDLEGQFDIWQTAHEDAAALVPPASMAHIHAPFVRGAEAHQSIGRDRRPGH